MKSHVFHAMLCYYFWWGCRLNWNLISLGSERVNVSTFGACKRRGTFLKVESSVLLWCSQTVSFSQLKWKVTLGFEKPSSGSLRSYCCHRSSYMKWEGSPVHVLAVAPQPHWMILDEGATNECVRAPGRNYSVQYMRKPVPPYPQLSSPWDVFWRTGLLVVGEVGTWVYAEGIQSHLRRVSCDVTFCITWGFDCFVYKVE